MADVLSEEVIEVSGADDTIRETKKSVETIKENRTGTHNLDSGSENDGY